jgi:hypothetical protein
MCNTVLSRIREVGFEDEYMTAKLCTTEGTSLVIDDMPQAPLCQAKRTPYEEIPFEMISGEHVAGCEKVSHCRLMRQRSDELKEG